MYSTSCGYLCCGRGSLLVLPESPRAKNQKNRNLNRSLGEYMCNDNKVHLYVKSLCEQIHNQFLSLAI